jgi:DNA-binding GntR family transcriptional regulator
MSTGSEDAVDRIAAAVTQGILAGTFVPGQHLPEGDLSRKLSVSRGSLREAMKRLAAENIVTLAPYRGAFVDVLDRRAAVDLMDISELLACVAARSVADAGLTSAGKIDMARAAKNLLGQNSQFGVLESWREFFAVVLMLTANREMMRIFPLARSDLVRSQIVRLHSFEQWGRLTRDLQDVAAAIIDQRPQEAEHAMRAHFIAVRQAVERLPAEASC